MCQTFNFFVRWAHLPGSLSNWGRIYLLMPPASLQAQITREASSFVFRRAAFSFSQIRILKLIIFYFSWAHITYGGSNLWRISYHRVFSFNHGRILPILIPICALGAFEGANFHFPTLRRFWTFSCQGRILHVWLSIRCLAIFNFPRFNFLFILFLRQRRIWGVQRSIFIT